LHGHKTLLIIAHRLSSVQHSDNIVVLSQGKVVEQGNHEHLCQQGGQYADLVAHSEFK
jgi:ABC-type multidrug transport system fused ATPase/permease subunit